MKNKWLIHLVIMLALTFAGYSSFAQGFSDAAKNEITLALKKFNTAAQNASTEQMMKLFDDSENIMFIGSDSAEIWKGKDQIRGHLNSIFPMESVSLDMNRVDIDGAGNIAWVFVDGAINITTEKGDKMKAPYRFSGVLVKKGHEWKWRMFSGSSPAGK
jgi:ketosteroid isomerase-like protein